MLALANRLIFNKEWPYRPSRHFLFSLLAVGVTAGMYVTDGYSRSALRYLLRSAYAPFF